MKRKVKKITLGYSVVADYRICATKFNLAKIERLSKPTIQDNTSGSPLLFGTYWHKLQELYHNGTPANAAISQVLAEASKESLATVYPEAKRSLHHLTLLFEHYVATFPDPFGEFKPYDQLQGKPAFEFETEFILSTNPLIVWRQRYDGIVTLSDGRVACLEHKTSSMDLSKDLRERMLPNAQAVGYVYGLRRALNIPAEGVLFNGACTYRPMVNPGYKYRGKGSPPPLFLREFVKIEEWMLDEWIVQTVRTIKRMIEDIEDNTFDNNAPDACTIFNGRCKFAKICNASPLDRDRIKAVNYEEDTYEGFKIEFE